MFLYRRCVCSFTAMVLVLLLPVVVQARPGEFDPTFGFRGRVRTEIVGADTAAPSALAVRPDGRIVIMGVVTQQGPPEVRKGLLAQYDTSGKLDASFGVSGIVTPLVDVLTGVSLLATGQLVVVGGNGGRSLVQRYTADGTLDTSFGVGGSTTVNFGEDDDGFTSVVVQADGKIVAAGNSFILGPSAVFSQFALARFNADGSSTRPSVTPA